MVPCSTGEPDECAAKYLGGCVWADGNNPVNTNPGGPLVSSNSSSSEFRAGNTDLACTLRIHQKQVLALFGIALPFAMVTTMGWWAVPITSLVIFTLYGIDGIASRLEDPFGKDKIDINMDAVVEDVRAEILVLLDEWKRLGEAEEGEGRDWFIRGKAGMGEEVGVGRRVRFEE